MDMFRFSEGFFRQTQGRADEQLMPLIRDAKLFFEGHNIMAISNRWLVDAPWKRVIYYKLFEDILFNKEKLSLLEVGGNISFCTLLLCKRHCYTLLELASHEGEEHYRKLERALDKKFFIHCDWSEYEIRTEQFDLVIANDLFPNVDQRLYEFVERFIPLAKMIRLTLTYYKNTYFTVKRVPSGELLTVKPWELEQIREFVNRYKDRIVGYSDCLEYEDLKEIVFGNCRNVIALEIKGNL